MPHRLKRLGKIQSDLSTFKEHYFVGKELHTYLSFSLKSMKLCKVLHFALIMAVNGRIHKPPKLTSPPSVWCLHQG